MFGEKVTTREAILDAAFAIAREEGVDGLSIRKLAAKVGIGLGTMYNYFPNKEAVVSACRSRFWQEILKDQEKLVRQGTGFTDFLLQYYAFLSVRLSNDDSSWLTEMDPVTRRSVLVLFRYVLDADKRVKHSIWNMETSPDTFVEHVRVNLLALLQAKEKDCQFFVFLLEHFLYEV